MSDEPALLAAILAHPDEDTPRLMYADWLEEHRQSERAEFIRIQCEATADETAEERAAELEERNRAKWLAGFPSFSGARWEFRRGFPEYLDIPADMLLDRYEAFARVPWLRFLSVSDVRDSDLRDFVNRQWSKSWCELELQALEGDFLNDHYETVTAGVMALAGCSQVAQLRRLQLSQCIFTREGVRALAKSPHFESLENLQIDEQGDNSLFAPLRKRFGERLALG